MKYKCDNSAMWQFGNEIQLATGHGVKFAGPGAKSKGATVTERFKLNAGY